ncbi:MAG: hypothetical protein ABSF63_15090 [Candidatus Bathyarchaeia archaeon]
MARKRDQKRSAKQTATIQKLRRELRQVKEQLRQHQIRDIEDLQIALNLPEGNGYSKLTRKLASFRDYPQVALESLRKALFAVLIQRNDQTQTENSAPTRSDYIQ